MASIKVILRESKLNSKGLAPLYLRITKDRRTTFKALKKFVKPSEWEADAEKVNTTHSSSVRMNQYIRDQKTQAEDKDLELMAKDKRYSVVQLKDKLKSKGSFDFFTFADQYVEGLQQTRQIATHRKVRTVVNKMREFMDGRLLYFDDLTPEFLRSYEKYLITAKENKTNTVHTELKNLRTIINEAINRDLMDRNSNPFLKHKLRLENTQRDYLTEEELAKIEALKMDKSKVLYHHCNAYIFAAYSGGLRVSDILKLRWSNFDGEKLNIKIHKTGTTLSIKLPNRSLSILDEYKEQATKENKKGSFQNHFIFPLLKLSPSEKDSMKLFNAISSATAYLNKDLKTIAKLAGIEKKFSFHSSRHTWATRALKKGMRIEYVSKLMGHSDIKETQIYAKIINAELDKAMDVFNK